MLSFRASLVFVLTAALTTSPAVALRAHRSANASSTRSHAVSSARSHVAPSSGHRRSARSSSGSTRISASSTRASRKTRVIAERKPHILHGQQAIEPSRVAEIQQALIREHYLGGEATGEWDSTTITAMQKYQADQGWQTKLMPDSRALKKLGLGPDYSDAINAKTASFGPPPSISTIPGSQTSGFTTSSGIATDSNR